MIDIPNHTRRSVFHVRMVAALIVFLILFPALSLAESAFPLYPAIKDNVDFWDKVYSRYSTNSAVIHDRRDLSKIYGVINLLDRKLPGAERLNRVALKTVEKNYSTILRKLASGKAPSTEQERKVAAMFTGKDRRVQMKKAATGVRSQTGLKERFREGFIRSGAYMKQLKATFSKHGLPLQLAYLPHVESSFNHKAYSKFGAAGMWQFTRATGKQYMRINEVIDERMDPFISGDAAARYLKNSYSKLGNWPMALTAYNYGTSGMMRAKKALGSYEKVFARYDKGHFGFASRNFYSEFLAAMRVAQRLEKEQGLSLDKPLSFYTLKLPGYMSISHISRHFKVSPDTIRKLNPALKQVVYKGKKLAPKGYELRLPKNNSIKGLAQSIPKSYIRSSQKRDHIYKVKKGDTAGGIAARHKISLRQLIHANSLDRNATIYIGQRLRIPDGQVSTSTPKGTITQRTVKRKTGETQHTIPILSDTKKATPGITTPIVAREGGDQETIVVQPEESLTLYASWLKIDESRLRKINKIGKLDGIHPGQQITIPYDKVSAAHFAEERAEFLHENETDFFHVYKIIQLKPYKVVSGDNLWELCNKKFNIPLWLLKKYNKNLDYTGIHTGQELTVPIVQTI